MRGVTPLRARDPPCIRPIRSRPFSTIASRVPGDDTSPMSAGRWSVTTWCRSSISIGAIGRSRTIRRRCRNASRVAAWTSRSDPVLVRSTGGQIDRMVRDADRFSRWASGRLSRPVRTRLRTLADRVVERVDEPRRPSVGRCRLRGPDSARAAARVPRPGRALSSAGPERVPGPQGGDPGGSRSTRRFRVVPGAPGRGLPCRDRSGRRHRVGGAGSRALRCPPVGQRRGEAKNHFASSLRDQGRSAGFLVETAEASP